MQESKDEFSEVTSLPDGAVVLVSHSPCLCLEVVFILCDFYLQNECWHSLEGEGRTWQDAVHQYN